MVFGVLGLRVWGFRALGFRSLFMGTVWGVVGP